ncbi:MAG: hypothetical protein ACT4P4_02140 [Betaproteobacteria bacterium]
MRTTIKVAVLAVGALSAYSIYQQRRREEELLARAPGSTTNASDAVDDVEIAADAGADEVLDAGIEQTFPASDPVSIDSAYRNRA